MKNITQAVAEPCLEQAGSDLAGTEWKTSRSHINVITILRRNVCILLISFIVLSCLFFHFRSHISSPLDGSSKCLFQWLIHLKDSNNLKQLLNTKQQKISFQIQTHI